MSGGIIELNAVETVRKLLRDQFQINLKADTIKMGELVENALSSFGFDNPLEIKCFSLPLHRSNGLDSFGCHRTALKRLQAQARLVLAPGAHTGCWMDQQH
jgi:hypothetical protein